MPGASAHHGPPGRGRAREGDLVHVGVLDQRRAGHLAEPGDDVEDAGRDAGLERQPAELEARERGELGRLQDDRVPGGERGRALAAGDVEREVPGDDHPDDAGRLAAHVVERGVRQGKHAAGDGADGAGEEAPRVPARREVDERGLADRLSDVVALDLGQVVALGLDQLGQAQHEAGSLVGVEVAPGREGRPSGAHGLVDVLGLRGRDVGDGAVGGRVDGRDGRAAGRLDPLAADQEPGLKPAGIGRSGDGVRPHGFRFALSGRSCDGRPLAHQAGQRRGREAARLGRGRDHLGAWLGGRVRRPLDQPGSRAAARRRRRRRSTPCARAASAPAPPRLPAGGSRRP